MIHLKRAYEKALPEDGFRILVDRLWPRGVSKDDAHIDLWLKEVAPSTELRKWFNHEVGKWEEFQRRYSKELHSTPDPFEHLRHLAQQHKTITLVYAAKDGGHNEAVILRELLTAT